MVLKGDMQVFFGSFGASMQACLSACATMQNKYPTATNLNHKGLDRSPNVPPKPNRRTKNDASPLCKK